MALQLAEAELVGTGTMAVPVAGPAGGCQPDITGDAQQMTAARGIVAGVLMAAPFWALLALAIYLIP